jgi:hypothetical protein
MAVTSKCGACGKSDFELAEAKIRGARHKNHFVQCGACGVVVGVLIGRDAGTLLDDALKELAEIKAMLAAPPQGRR